MSSPVFVNRGDLERPIPVTSELSLVEPNDTGAVVRPRARSERIERASNVVIATLLIALTSPVMLLFAVIVKLTSQGPIFYSQARVGIDRRRRSGSENMYDRRSRDLGGLPFIIYKFRTMYVGAEGKGAVWATQQDSRVTPVGRVMRKLRIDELPQLFNVLAGDMNIVGPRPERPSIFSQLRGDIAEYPLRQLTRPGITGWAQINQSYDTSIDDVRRKVRYDLEYIERQGLGEDLMIMAKTVPVMLFRRGGW